MEKLILTAILLLISAFVWGQGITGVVNARQNLTDSVYEWFMTGYPTPSLAPTYMRTQWDRYATFKQKKFQFSLFDSTKNDGTPKRIAWLDNFGYLKVSPASAFTVALSAGAITSALGGTPIIPSGTGSQYYKGDGSLGTLVSQTNADWNSSSGISQILNKPNLNVYYLTSNPSNYVSASSTNTLTNKSGNISMWSNDTGYLTTYSETDPIWTAASSNYYDKTTSDSRYLQNFIESDPTVPSNVKSISSSDITNWNGKFDNPTGTTGQYLRGDGSLASFPSIPAAQVNSDWNSVSGVAQVLNKPTTLSGYGITDAQITLNGTGFVKAVGTTIFYDNSTYLTSEIDGSVTNEIQILSLNSGSLQLSLNGGTVVTSSLPLSNSQVTTALTYVPYNSNNPNGYISSYTETDPQFNTKFGAKTTTDLTEGTNLYLTAARTRTALSQGTGISYNNSTGVIVNNSPDQNVIIVSTNTTLLNVGSAYPGFTLTPYAPTTQTVTRAINSSTFQLSTTKIAWVYYTIRINCVATIGSTSAATVALQQSIDNGSTWEEVGQVENSNTVSLAIVLNSNTTQTSQIGGVIRAASIVRMVTTNSGATVTYVRGQETY